MRYPDRLDLHRAFAPLVQPARCSIKPARADGLAPVRQVFDTSSMTARWRLATLTMPGYHPALDLAAVAPDGSMAGFYVAWLDQASATAHIEPLGISPGLRRLGLGHAMVSAVLGRARDCGAQVVTVQTGAVHGPAVAFYQRVGFEAACRVLRKGQWLPAQPS